MLEGRKERQGSVPRSFFPIEDRALLDTDAKALRAGAWRHGCAWRKAALPPAVPPPPMRFHV